ncbi:translation initiation factor eIF3 subunit (macronuclear) [Tetrahymena thermophila SB210]|uniref:Translation initiation factor eIF3 subunit n=1 Tax=Tetrahymena thermophila (strain SB210) TaxID=312017 RepID=I7LXA6_TETTS|nr:translation initiation factor eIF3 subunit [Tetrahymena thermophila SB210]EAS04269.3 translation initiation factor eIF3 subunit [Tetrahymena thermophila SB210]|eukprot:XP_001024514.3 translation initiation factor eIF3 subunit [Tetrahymena thermophila SB210]
MTTPSIRTNTNGENRSEPALPQGIFFSKKVHKISSSKLFSNERILQLEDAQLKYFKPVKNFVEDKPVSGKFKKGINIEYIQAINLTSEKKNRIVIEFLKKGLFDMKRKSIISKKENDIETWEFICKKSEQAEFIKQKIFEAKSSKKEDQTNHNTNQYNSIQKKESQSSLNFNGNQKENLFIKNFNEQLNEEDEEDEEASRYDEQEDLNNLKKKMNQEKKNQDDKASPIKKGNDQSPLKNTSQMKLNSQPSLKGSFNQLPSFEQVSSSPRKENNIAHTVQRLANFKGKRQSILEIKNDKDTLSNIPYLTESYQKTTNETFKINMEKVQQSQSSSSSSNQDPEEEKDVASPMLETKRNFQRNGNSSIPNFSNLLPQPTVQSSQLQKTQSQQVLSDQNSDQELKNVPSTPALRNTQSAIQQNISDGGSMTTANRIVQKQKTLTYIGSDSNLNSQYGGSPYQRLRLGKQHTTIGYFPMSSDNSLKDSIEKAIVRRNAENSHEFRYHSFLESSLKASTLEDQLKEGIKLFLYLGQFREKAIRAAKSLVEDLMQPKPIYEPRFKSMVAIPELEKIRELNSSQNLKSQSPTKKNQGTKDLFQLDPNKEIDIDDMFYIPEENVIAKVFFTKQINLVPDYLQDISYNQEEGVDYFDSSSIKFGGDQFRILNSISSSYIKIRKYDPTYSLRVPLSVIVDYLGFKILVYARPQYEKNIVYGPDIEKDGTFVGYKKVQKYEQKIEEDAEKLRQRLRIKSHYFGWKHDEPIQCILTFETEIHKSAGDRATKSNLVKYQKDTILIDQDKEEDQFYIENYNDFYPINSFLDCQFNKNQMRYPRKIRPEILLKKKKSLNPEAYFSQIKLGKNPDNTNIREKQDQMNYFQLIKIEKQDQLDIEEVEQYSLYLSTTKLFKLIKQFDSLDIIPYDSHTIKEALHSNGLNIKYISYIAEHSNTPYVKLLFEQEMVARTVKRMIRCYLTQFTFQSRKTSSSILRRGNILEMNNQQQKANDIKFNTNTNQKKAIIETLNLIFENSAESQQYWEQINTQILMEYGYRQKVSLDQFEKGGLLNAIHYHSQFILSYGTDIFDTQKRDRNKYSNAFAQQILQQLEMVDQETNYEEKSDVQMPWQDQSNFEFQPAKIVDASNISEEVEEPVEILTLENFLDFQYESKMFDYKDIPIQIYANLQYPSDPQKQVQTILIQDKISQAINQEHKERFFTLYGLSKSYFSIGYYKECIETLNKCISCLDYYPSILLVDPLCLLIQCYIILKQNQKVQYLFWKTEEIINFNLGKMHPLHCRLLNNMALYYEFIGQYQEQIILMKASCNLVQKIVGTNHKRTAQSIFELATILSQNGMTSQAIGQYETAFYIYTSIKGDQNKNSADIAYKIALESFTLRELEKCGKYSTYCLQFFEGKENIYLNKIVELKIIQFKILKIQQETNQDLSNILNEIWLYMYQRDYTNLDHIVDILKEYVQYYLKTLTDQVKVFLSLQFELILNGLINKKILDSFLIEEVQQKSKLIIMKEILFNGNLNNPINFIERTFITLAEDQQKKVIPIQKEDDDENNDKSMKKKTFKFQKQPFLPNQSNQNKDQKFSINQIQNGIDQSSQNQDNKNDDYELSIKRCRSLFEHLICLVGVPFFKSIFLQNIV